MDIRKFKLINSIGEEWDLNDLDSFLTDVRGLGFEQTFEFEDVGDFFLGISKHPKQSTPRGIINFSSYEEYNSFVFFIQKTPLVLKYKIPIDSVDTPSEVYLDVEVKSLKKGDMESGVLRCPIEFLALGYYYVNIDYPIETESGTGYTYTYPFTYSNESAGSVTMLLNVNIDSPCRISIFGPCTNPSWSHYVNGVEVGSGKVNCSVIAGERMIVDCQKIPYSIKKYNNSLVETEDCYGESDFSTGRFIYLKEGTNKLSFTHEGSETLNVTINAKINMPSA